MPEPLSLLSFVDPSIRRTMPTALRHLSAMSYIESTGDPGTQINHRLSWIGDWWFSTVTGSGNVHCHMDPSGILPRDYALLTLALEGRSPVKMRSSPVGKPACITLTSLDSFYELSSTHPFNHIIVHLPRTELATADGCPQFGQTLPAGQGAGAVLAGALRALTQASETAGGADRSLRALLPSFAQMVRTGMAQNGSGAKERTNRRDRILEYLRTHLADPTLVSGKAAAACGLSRRQLYREFNALESFSETLRRLRLEKAAFELFNQPHVPIGELAQRCGFANADCFAGHFRAFYGCTPREHRKRSLPAPRL